MKHIILKPITISREILPYNVEIQGKFSDWDNPMNGSIKAQNLGRWIYIFTYIDKIIGETSRQIYPPNITIEQEVYNFED